MINDYMINDSFLGFKKVLKTGSCTEDLQCYIWIKSLKYQMFRKHFQCPFLLFVDFRLSLILLEICFLLWIVRLKNEMYCNPGIWRHAAQEFASKQMYILHILLTVTEGSTDPTHVHTSLPVAVIVLSVFRMCCETRLYSFCININIILFFFNKTSADNQNHAVCLLIDFHFWDVCFNNFIIADHNNSILCI